MRPALADVAAALAPLGLSFRVERDEAGGFEVRVPIAAPGEDDRRRAEAAPSRPEESEGAESGWDLPDEDVSESEQFHRQPRQPRTPEEPPSSPPEFEDLPAAVRSLAKRLRLTVGGWTPRRCISRAVFAGWQDRAKAEGDVRFPRAVPSLDLPTVVYIVLVAHDGSGPYRCESYGEYSGAVRTATGFAAGSVSRGLPSRSEALAYLHGAGHSVAALPPRWWP